MVKRVVKSFAFLVLAIFLISFISADFELGEENYSIQKYYAPGEEISGWINISFDEQDSNSIFETSEGNTLSLIDLIKKNSDYEYECNPSSCSVDYELYNKETSKSLDLNAGETTIVGLNIKGKTFSDITSFSMRITSNNPDTIELPLAIDILNNGEYEWQASEPSKNASSEDSGCFLNTEILTAAKIAQTYYCEKVELQQSPEVEIGAYVIGNESVNFDMRIQNVETGEYKSCTANASGTGRISCIPNFKIKEDGDYYVCIKAQHSTDNDKYQIYYEQINPCGFVGDYEDEYDFDFEIFAKTKGYASSIDILLNDNELKNISSSITNLEAYIEGYITDVYNENCEDGCIIPIKIYSGVNQRVTISNISVGYIAGISTETRNIYDVEEISPKITSDFQKLYLNNSGFLVSEDYGNDTYWIDLDGNQVLSYKMVIGGVPELRYLTPIKTAIDYPTAFRIMVNSTLNVTKYTWDFGDKSAKETTTNFEAIHTYNTTGSYTITVNVENEVGRNSTKSFNITVGSAAIVIPEIIEEDFEKISTIEDELKNYSAFEQKSIKRLLDIDEIKENVTDLNESFGDADDEEEYRDILAGLLALDIPDHVLKVAQSKDSLLFVPEQDNVNLDYITEITEKDYDATNVKEYQEAILAWNVDNTEITLDYDEISFVYGRDEGRVIKFFKIYVSNNGIDDAYIILKNMSNLLMRDEGFEEGKGYYYWQILGGSSKEIEFSMTEEIINFENLPMFISPEIVDLTLNEWSIFEETGKLKRWVFFTLIVIGILFLAMIAWIVLQIWYKREYETYLFKDRNNLYNIMNYIANAKKSGLNDAQIAEKLKKAGWSSEQIRYAIRKFEGKNTGMWEIPISKILKENKKNREEKKKKLEKEKAEKQQKKENTPAKDSIKKK